MLLGCNDDDPKPKTPNNWVKILIEGEEEMFTSDSITFFSLDTSNFFAYINVAVLFSEDGLDSLILNLNIDSIYTGLKLEAVDYYDGPFLYPYPFPSYQIVYHPEDPTGMLSGYFNNSQTGDLEITGYEGQVITGQFSTKLEEYVDDPNSCSNCHKPTGNKINVSGEFRLDLSYNTK
jgi:hypothetical protein